MLVSEKKVSENLFSFSFVHVNYVIKMVMFEGKLCNGEEVQIV